MNTNHKNSSEPVPRSLGPVLDLERHLPAEWWRTLFNSLYLKTDGDVVENDENTTTEIDLITRVSGIEHNDRILDLCCGQGRHSIEMARRGFKNVTGLDRSRYLIRLARQRAKKQQLSVTFREGDARAFRHRGDPFHCIMILGNSFGYFERSQDDLAVLRSSLNALAPGGTLVLDLTDGDWMRSHFEPRSWEWIDQNHFVCRERSLSADEQRIISREVITHVERGVIIDQFYAERLYSESAIRDLLAKAGFEAIRQHENIQAASDRNQDLGMMKSRRLLTASRPKSFVSVLSAEIPFPKVTVLLGDPRLPDDVKLNGQFNAEDFSTIEKLKKALSELDGYEFTYLDNHASWLAGLRADPPAFVLNLCDEGYNNDAFLELHVPAYLEMLNVPYTGAGPFCLGLCYNKALVRAIAESLEIPVPLETYYAQNDHAAMLPSTFPALVKPNYGDSSIGITKQAVVGNTQEFVEYIDVLSKQLPGRPMLIQEYLQGAEYSAGIVGNPGTKFHCLPILQVDYSRLPAGLPQILGYESKWDPASPYWDHIRYHEADLDEEQARLLLDNSMKLFERLGCRDYARFDFRTDSNGVIKLLEVNPNPGWCWDGKLNFMAEFAGLRYADLLHMIIRAAQERYGTQSQLPAANLVLPREVLN